MFTIEQKKTLLLLARQSIECRFSKESVLFPDDIAFQAHRGIFVTLHKKGELRGCIGYIKGFKDLVQSIYEMAQSAAFKDPRFSPIKDDELKEIEIEISVLSDMILVSNTQDILIGRDGLLLIHPYGSGLLLPQVPVEWNWDLPTFLVQLCHKALLPADSWMDDKAKLYRFSAEIFSESDQISD